MKRIINILAAAAAMTLTACWNEDISYKDYDYQTVYFPYQYPVRTLSLGNDLIDNSLDRAHEFNIGICIGGYYGTSKRDWEVSFEVDGSLVHDNLYNAAGDRLQVLPPSMYTLSPSGKTVIKEGTNEGLVRVHLEDEFFSDPLALKGCYVIPLKITGVEAPVRILSGTPKETVTDPDIHNTEDWEVMPMDFTLFGVKYVNRMHGSWLRRGCRTERSSTGSIVEQTTYRQEYVEYDEVVSLTSTGLYSCTGSFLINGENWDLSITDDGAGYLELKSLPSSKYAVTAGSGQYRRDSQNWGGTPEKPSKRDGIYLDYFYKNNAGNTCEISDTLVFRDRGITIETSRPTIK